MDLPHSPLLVVESVILSSLPNVPQSGEDNLELFTRGLVVNNVC